MKKTYLILMLACCFAAPMAAMSEIDEVPSYDIDSIKYNHAQNQHWKYSFRYGIFMGLLANTTTKSTGSSILLNLVALGGSLHVHHMFKKDLIRGFYPELKLDAQKKFLFRQPIGFDVRPTTYPIVPLTGYLLGAVSGRIAQRVVPYLWAGVKGLCR